MRIFLSLLAYLVSLVLVAAGAFLFVLMLAGPHAGQIPRWMEPGVLVLGWIVVLVAPAWLAWWVWMRLGRAGSPPSPPARQPDD